MNTLFPKGFFWGASTSSHQVEGENINDWSAWEKKVADRQTQIAKQKQWPGYIVDKYPNPLQEENYISGSACDHYNRYEEDFDIARQLGHNAHRFSIEWSRIEPEEGRFDLKEIEHYKKVARALKKRGMEPFVTLWHGTLPLWMRDKGGVESKEFPKFFARYTERVALELKDDVTFWITINEPTVYAGQAYFLGVFPPNVRSMRRSNKVLSQLIRAHRLAFHILHRIGGETVSVGLSHNMHWHIPARPASILDTLAVSVLDYIRDRRVLYRVRKYQDFIGLNYYFCDTVRFVGWGGRFGPVDIQNEEKENSDIGWSIAPEGVYYILRYLAEFKKPIYITENGIADTRDAQRTQFLTNHIAWTKKAIDEGVDVKGYFYWSLLDNFEWDKGFWPRFGLVEVDYKTQVRTIRKSAWEYARIAKGNRL